MRTLLSILFWPEFISIYLLILFISCILWTRRENQKTAGKTTRSCKLHAWDARLDDNGLNEYYCTKCGFHTGYQCRGSF